MATNKRTLPALMSGDQIYTEWQIPRGMLTEAANAPVDALEFQWIMRNGVQRKYYRTADIVARFGCDMDGRTIAEQK